MNRAAADNALLAACDRFHVRVAAYSFACAVAIGCGLYVCLAAGVKGL